MPARPSLITQQRTAMTPTLARERSGWQGAGAGACDSLHGGNIIARMRRQKLDRIDLKILSELQEEGRMTNVELARRAGISAPPCLRRLRALEESGYIRGYRAQLDAEALGFEVAFFALVGLDSQAETVLSAFEREVGAWPEVRECHMARGPHDFVLRLVARNTAHENALTQKLTSAAHVVTVQTIQVIRTAKLAPGVPVEQASPSEG